MVVDHQGVLPGYRAVSLEGLAYTFSVSATPLQLLRRWVASQLGLAPVPGRILAKSEWTVWQCPVNERHLLMNPDDWRVLARLTRAWAMSACRGDAALESRLWKMNVKARSGPFTYRHIPQGLCWYEAS